MAVTSYAIAIGSNRRHGRHGSPRAIVAAAIAAIAAEGIAIVARSPIVTTAPMGPSHRRFANAAIVVRSVDDPPDLLGRLKAIEQRFGRRRGRRWGPRVLDLDILLWSGGEWSSPRLTIPHPGLAQRAFVLDPLVHVAAGWSMPASAISVRHLRARLRRSRPVDPPKRRP